MKELKILHQSDNFIVVDKEFDIIINTDDPSRLSLQKQLITTFPHLINKKLHFGFYFPHRLDYSTSGVMCIALTKKSCAAASSAFRDRSTKKYYLALVRGHVSEQMIKVDQPIGEDVESNNGAKIMSSQGEQARDAISKLLVLERGMYESNPATKVLLRPLTGRRHQLRVHCQSIGHTIVGDYTYSAGKDSTPPRMFLHSYRLIMPNNLEELDISTVDPFTEADVPSWHSVSVIQRLDHTAIQLLSS